MTRPIPPLTVVLSLYCLVLPPLSLLAPTAVVPLLAAAALVAGGLAWRSGLRLALPDRRVLAILALLLGWCFVASFWGLGLEHALILIARIAALFAAGGVLFAVAGALPDEQRDRLGRWLALGVAATLALMAAEIVFDYPLFRALRPNRHGLEEIQVALSRGATAMAILVWPVAAALWIAGARRAALALPIAAGLILPFLASLSAVSGFVAGAVVTAVSSLHPKAGRAVLILATVAIFVGGPLAAKGLYAMDWQDAAWLPWSAQHRVEIWNFTADLIAQKPVFGWGFDASRHITDILPKVAASGRPTMSLHPHNGPLQILLEIGLVGGAIVLSLAVLLIARLDSLPTVARTFAQGMYASILIIASVAFGLWQNQWLALVISAVVVVRLTAPRHLRDGETPGKADLGADARA